MSRVMKKVDALPASTFSAFLLLLYPCRHVGGSGQLQPLHSALYDVDEDAIVLGSQIMAGVVFAANGD